MFDPPPNSPFRVKPLVAASLACVAAALLPGPSARAQGGDAAQLPPEVRAIDFTGDSTFGEGVLRTVIRSKESAGAIPRFFHGITGGHIGAPAEYFDAEQFDEDKRQLADFYRDNGFYDASVAGTAALDTPAHAVTLTFAIRENRRSFEIGRAHV